MEQDEKEKNITIADVAEALGVSKTTVSRAISGKGRIGKETRNRVLAYIEEHNYKPNVIAKGLAQSKTYNLCVVMPGEYDVVDLTFFQECLFGIQEIAGIMEYDILLSICQTNDISSLERIIANRKVDGAILMRTFVEDAQIEFLQKKNVPFVTIGSSTYPYVVQIDHNHKSACKELTSIILMKNLKKIALIGGDETHVVTQSRLRGFREAYAKMGEEIDESLLFLNLDNHILVDKAVKEALERKVDCILCMDDAVCSRVLKMLREQQIKVPQEVKIASFYNSTILENSVPSITSLSFDAKELGMVACRTLLDLIEGIEVKERTLLSYEVVLKESTK
ncbi:MAG: LacI family DNA-binding transcriptional regulator [Roseburia sp.]